MMVVSNKQIEEMEKIKLEKFILLSIASVRNNFPGWAGGKSDSELRKLIRQMIGLGKNYNIIKDINLQKLVKYKIEFDFNLVKQKQLKACLCAKHTNEDLKLEEFYISLVSNNYSRTTLTLKPDSSKKAKGK